MDIKGSLTEKNLMKALLGESLARNKYTYYSKVAKNEGYEQIAGIFIETAENEREHAKLFFSFLDDSRIEFTHTLRAGIGNTLANLKNAFEGENEENTTLYPGFGAVAKDEGFMPIYDCFMNVTEVEKHHEARYRALYKNVAEGSVFKKENEMLWKCLNCGRIVKGYEAVEICPTCHHPRAYFEVLCDNF